MLLDFSTHKYHDIRRPNGYDKSTHTPDDKETAAFARAVEFWRLPDAERGDESEGVFREWMHASLDQVVQLWIKDCGSDGLFYYLYVHTRPRHKEGKLKFDAIHCRDIKINSVTRYLVHNVIPMEGFGVFWGADKTGKTFMLIDILMHVAAGIDYRGLRVRKGVVVYVACEGGFGMQTRIVAYKQSRFADIDWPDFYLVKSSFRNPGDVQRLINDVTAKLPLGTEVAVIVIDTLNRSIEGSESDDKAMGAFIKGCSMLQERFGNVVIAVHHTGHKEKDRMRGHSSLPGSVDFAIGHRLVGKHLSDKDARMDTWIDRLKDGPEEVSFYSKVDKVTVGTDDNGEDITTLVVLPCDGTVILEEDDDDTPTNKDEVYRMVDETITAKGEIRAQLTSESLCVLRYVCRDSYANTVMRKDKTKTLDSCHRIFRGQLGKLIKDGKVATGKIGKEPYLWIPRTDKRTDSGLPDSP